MIIVGINSRKNRRGERGRNRKREMMWKNLQGTRHAKRERLPDKTVLKKINPG